MSNKKTTDLLYESLFRKDDNLTPKQREQLTRYEAAFVFWLDKSYLSDRKIVEFLTKKFGISKSQAYIDVRNLQNIFGNIKNASKEWFRQVANEMVREAVEAISDEKAGKLDVLKAEAKIKAAQALVKINRLDKDDVDPIDWESIIPQSFEPVNDPAAAGLKSMSRDKLMKRIKKLKENYGEEIEVQDIDFEEMKKEVDGRGQ